MDLDAIARELNYDRDEYELDDGRVIRFRVEQDSSDVMDMWTDDAYGKIAPVETHRYSDYEAPRPDGFNGRARKISLRDESYWWQPPADVPDEQIAKWYQTARQLLEEGFYSFGVELRDEDGSVIDDEWMGGVEPSALGWDADAHDYRRDLLGDLLIELMGRDEDRTKKLADEDAEHQHPWGMVDA